MGKKRVTMNKVREIIRLHEEMGLSNRKIARALRISHPVVSQYITDVKAAGLTHKDIVDLETGMLRPVGTFVAILGASELTYVVIWGLLEKHNNMRFQRLWKRRRQLFEEIEKPALKPLPPSDMREK
jgi:DNA-binding transcriptional ArsR family regulator